MPATHDFPALISTQQDVDRACDQVAACSCIALDTEFVRTRTYAPKLGLLQIEVNGLQLCIDPLGGADLSTLWALLFAPERTTVLHSGKQDMEVMWYERGDVLHNLVDTQACAALLGYPAQIGYAGLVNELLSITVSKEQTRTDWTRRPLTDAQLTYAAEDVAHLRRLHDLLRERLLQEGRYEWAVEDSMALANLTLYKPDPDSAWQRIKSLPFLPSPEQARARALAAWREAQAVKLDKPRQWILADAAILEMAAKDPASHNALASLDELPASMVRKQADALLETLADGNAQHRETPERFIQSIPDRDQDKARMKKLMKQVRAAAEELSIAPEVLASKRDINDMLREPDQSRVTNGWRLEVIGRNLLAAV